MEIKAEEQQQLLSRSRAVSEKMSSEVNPVALDATNYTYLSQIEASKEEKVINCHQEDKPALMANNVGVTSTEDLFFQEDKEIESKRIDSVGSSIGSPSKHPYPAQSRC